MKKITFILSFSLVVVQNEVALRHTGWAYVGFPNIWGVVTAPLGCGG